MRAITIPGLGIANYNPYVPGSNAYNSYQATIAAAEAPNSIYGAAAANYAAAYDIAPSVTYEYWETPNGLSLPTNPSMENVAVSGGTRATVQQLKDYLATYAAQQTSAGIANEVRLGVISVSSLIGDIPVQVANYCSMYGVTGCDAATLSQITRDMQAAVRDYYAQYTAAVVTQGQPGTTVTPTPNTAGQIIQLTNNQRESVYTPPAVNDTNRGGRSSTATGNAVVNAGGDITQKVVRAENPNPIASGARGRNYSSLPFTNPQNQGNPYNPPIDTIPLTNWNAAGPVVTDSSSWTTEDMMKYGGIALLGIIGIGLLASKGR